MARILVVDDDSVIRELLVDVLEDESGHDVIVAANGREALAKLEDHRVDAIVCDINMPVMDGFELVRSVRADPELHDLPVLMISAAAKLERVDPALDVDLMLEKPFELNSLLACVGFILDGVRAGTRAGTHSVRVTRRRAASQLERIVQPRHHQPHYGTSSAD